MIANPNAGSLSHAVERDLRLDLFRGIGLCMIFLDHIPHDVVAWLTLRNYGFSDAAESTTRCTRTSSTSPISSDVPRAGQPSTAHSPRRIAKRPRRLHT